MMKYRIPSGSPISRYKNIPGSVYDEREDMFSTKTVRYTTADLFIHVDEKYYFTLPDHAHPWKYMSVHEDHVNAV